MRLSSKIIRQARELDRLLPPLLRPTHDLEAAKRELNWIKQELPRQGWKKAVQLRSHHVPLQYILGSQPFGDMDLIVRPGVLIPRWETEEWTNRIIDQISGRSKSVCVLELCTGSGCISLLINRALTKLGISNDVDAVELSQDALMVAQENKQKYELTVDFKQGDIFQYEPKKKYDIIVSNPPYIPKEDMKSSEKSVRMYEPQLALLGDLEFYERLCYIVENSGALDFIFELGYLKQAQRVQQLLSGWEIGLMNDSAGKNRCVVGSRPDSKIRLIECDGTVLMNA